MDLDTLLSMASISERFSDIVAILMILLNKWHIAFWTSAMVVINGGGLAILGWALLKSTVDQGNLLLTTVIIVLIANVLMIPIKFNEKELSTDFATNNTLVLAMAPYYTWRFFSVMDAMFHQDAEAVKVLGIRNDPIGLPLEKQGLFLAASNADHKPFLTDVRNAKDAYDNYLARCSSVINNDRSVPRESWLAVGLMGGGGIGMPEGYFTSVKVSNPIIRALGNLLDLNLIGGVDLRGPALDALEKANGDISNIDEYVGFPVLNRNFWYDVISQKGNSPTQKDYIIGSTHLGGQFAYPNLSSLTSATSSFPGSTVLPEYRINFFPNNCKEMYEVAHLSMYEYFTALFAIQNRQKSFLFGSRGVNSAWAASELTSREGVAAMVSYRSLQEILANEQPLYQKRSNQDLAYTRGSGGDESFFFSDLKAWLTTALHTLWISIKTFFLIYTIPALVIFNAFIIALLLTLFPFFAALSPLVGPDILTVWVKLVAVIFITSFLNWFILVAGADLIYIVNLITASHMATSGGDTNLVILAALIPGVIVSIVGVVEIGLVYLLVMRDTGIMRRAQGAQSGFSAGALIATAGGAFGAMMLGKKVLGGGSGGRPNGSNGQNDSPSASSNNPWQGGPGGG